MKVDVSIGEAIDKLSILELKLLKIKDESKQVEIKKEIMELSSCIPYKKCDYYKLLMYVNEKIWDMTDQIKTLTVTDPTFSIISNQIFEFNQKRFRIKNWYNINTNSSIKEQKSYDLSHCKILVQDIHTFYKKIPEIHYLALEYDKITIISSFNDKIKNIFKIPTIHYSSVNVVANNTILLENMELDKHIIHLFELPPIVYISGAKLGDFVHQLSVIHETFLTTGKKGILYIASIGDMFSFGLLNTYEETFQLITEQIYIKEYKIYNNEPYDINLSDWRKYNIEKPWTSIFNMYNVEWGKHKWLSVPDDNKWKDTIFISTTSYHPVYNFDYMNIVKLYKNVIFLDANEKETSIFKNILAQHNLNVEFYKPLNLYDLCVAINSCKLFIGNLSSPLAFAYALHKTSVTGLMKGPDIRHLGLEKITPNFIMDQQEELIFEKINKLF
jgi:hypothetical protein